MISKHICHVIHMPNYHLSSRNSDALTTRKIQRRRLCFCSLKSNGKKSELPLKARKISVPKLEEENKSLLLKKDYKRSGFNSLHEFFTSFGDTFKSDELGQEISLIVFPALISLAAEPIASLVDTAFIGQIGPVELAAVGVSISIFNIVSKLFNIPLLNVTTSFVAIDASSGKEEKISQIGKFKNHAKQEMEEAQVFSERREQNSQPGEYTIQENWLISQEKSINVQLGKNEFPRSREVDSEKIQMPAVSTALVTASALGLAEATILVLGAGYFVNVMGIPCDSPMHFPAQQYLTIRALGAPGAVVSLAIQGVFRGFKDTKTPLYATGVGNLINVALDPIFMFTLGFGVGGAAAATVVSEYFIAFVLLWNLNKQVNLLPTNIEELRFDRYITSGGLLFGRTVAALATFTIGTSMAARQGAIHMAAHQICLQVWLAVSLLTDSLALAGQALIATAISKKDYLKAKHVVFRVLQIGFGTGLASAMVLFVGFGPLSNLFTNDKAVMESISALCLFVAGTQPINAMAFIFDGLHYGVSDFAYAAYSMIIVGTISLTWLLIAPSGLGLMGIWTGLTLFMGLRMAAGFWRLSNDDGPWHFMWQYKDEEEVRTK